MALNRSSSAIVDNKAPNIVDEYETFLRNYDKLKGIEEQSGAIELLDGLVDQVKILRNSCALGTTYQELIVNLPRFFDVLTSILSNSNTAPERYNPLIKMSWQLVANVCVQNPTTQSLVWENLSSFIQSQLKDITAFTDIQLMIAYNIYKGGFIGETRPIFRTLVRICGYLMQPEHETFNFEFLHIFFEHFLTENNRLVALYGPLDSSERIIVLYYIATYIANGSCNGPVVKSMMEYISKEFKKKSDCVLKTVESYLDNIHPQEVVALLNVISKASGEDIYSDAYASDPSLFLNIGSLLQGLNSIGKKAQNIFTPMQKLEQVAPCSKVNSDFEKEISFEMKTMLVRASANLLYKNRVNQDYARELGIIMAILDCTTADARNPLIKEWSILAIRNLCENCPENQEYISKLCKVGDAPNEILTELSLELGSLRIRSSA